MHRRVERLADRAEPLETDARECRLERLADGLERALELAVLAGTIDVVEDRKQLRQDAARRRAARTSSRSRSTRLR